MEENFESLYNESLNETKRFDRTITGTVINISSKGEIFVDFGYKADGIIPLAEYSDEGKNPKDEFKPGDTITADVLKWNDGLGNVLLSYKRLKQRERKQKEREERIKKAEERAKQHEEYERQKAERQAEYEKQKAERAKSIEEFWDGLKVGQKYTGTITKIESYGVFVDLGVLKGLLHISEVFWNKEEKLEDKFNIGDEIEVTVKSFDKQERKISLSYPEKEENPWFKLVEKYNINDIVTCKVVKFAPFGAFLEIEKGLEGLVHNSEITTLRRVVKPEDELQLGQIVNAKILDIDNEKCKISLSIKELEGTSHEYGYDEYISKK